MKIFRGLTVLPVLLAVFILFLGGSIVYLKRTGRNAEDAWVCENGQWVKHGKPMLEKPDKPCVSGDIQEEQIPSVVLKESSDSSTTELSVSPAKGDDVVRTFFTLIGEKRISEAVGMMDANLVPDDSTKQQYGVVFNAFASIEVTAVEPVMQDPWTSGMEEYRVNLNVTLKPDAPHMVWQNGQETRFVVIQKTGETYKIHEIATGP